MRLSGQFIYFFIKIFCIKKHTSFCSNILICLKSIIKHTSNFHLDIMPRNIKETNNFSPEYFYTLKKHTSNFHLDIVSFISFRQATFI